MRKEVLFVLVAAVLWGTTGTAQALAPDASSPIVIGALRLFIGGMGLLLFVLIKGQIRLASFPKKTLLMSAVAMALYQPLFFTGVEWTGVATGTVITICSAPIFAGFIEWIYYKRKPDRIWLIATGLAILGCMILFQAQGSIEIHPGGILFSLGAGLAFASYTFFNKALVAKQSPDVVVALVFSIAALFLMPVLFFADLSWITEPNGALAIVHLGFVATSIAYFLFSRGLQGVSASVGVTLALAEPVTAAFLGLFVLREAISGTGYLGILLLMLGLLLLSSKDKLRRAKA